MLWTLCPYQIENMHLINVLILYAAIKLLPFKKSNPDVIVLGGQPGGRLSIIIEKAAINN